MQVPQSQPALVTLPHLWEPWPLWSLLHFHLLGLRINRTIRVPLFSFGSFSASLFWDKSTVHGLGSFGTAKPLSAYTFTAFIGWGLSGLQVLAVSNEICMNVHIQVLCFPFNCRERRGCLVGTQFLEKWLNCFPKRLYHFAFPPAGFQDSILSIPSPKLDEVWGLNF